MAGETAAHPKRIVVALDGSSQSLAALDASVRLAKTLGAEVVGVFVEDANLIQAASLSTTRIISYRGATTEGFSVQTVERSFRVSGRDLRHRLAVAAEAQDVPWHFEVRRGEVAGQILDVAKASDLLALGAHARTARRSRFGATAIRMSTEAPCTILLATHGIMGSTDIAVLSDGSPAILDLVRTALRTVKRPVMIFPSQPLPGVAEQLQRFSAELVQAGMGPASVATEIPSRSTFEAWINRPGQRFVVADRPSLIRLGLDPSELTTNPAVTGLLMSDCVGG